MGLNDDRRRTGRQFLTMPKPQALSVWTLVAASSFMAIVPDLAIADVGQERASSSGAESAAKDAAAAALFSEAKAKLADGETQAACLLFEQSLAFKRGIGTLFNLASCQETLNNTKLAFELYREVAELTREAGQDERSALAQQRAERLRNKLSFLVVSPTEVVDGLTIQRDGKDVSRDSFGKEILIDPGVHQLHVTAPNKQPLDIQVNIADKSGVTSLVIPALNNSNIVDSASVVNNSAEPMSVAAGASVPTTDAEPLADTQTSSEPSSARRTLTYGMGGLGVLGLAGAVVMSLEFKSDVDDAKALCVTESDCTDAEILKHNDLVDSAERARTWAIVSGSVGGALLVGAAVLWLTEPDDATEQAWVATPVVTTDGTLGATLQGRF